MIFDEVIKCHDAYKVETTGDTYMMASGVPNENGGQHIFEIAEIALGIREVPVFFFFFCWLFYEMFEERQDHLCDKTDKYNQNKLC